MEDKTQFFQSITLIRETIQAIKANSSKLLELKLNDKICDTAFQSITLHNDINMLDIRTLLRHSQTELDKQKTYLTEKKEAIDNLNLQLQSKLYEQHQLKNEISTCQSYSTPLLFKVLN